MPRWVALVLAIVAITPARGEDALRVSWGAHNAPPYAIADGGELKAGLIHDVGAEVARRLARRVAFVNVPRARIESQLRDGNVDVSCILNRQWLERPDDFDWTAPLFEETDILVQSSGSKPWTSVDDLARHEIATLQAYRYPSLDALFESRRVQRSDGASLDANMQRLALGRVDAVVDANVPIYYWLDHNGGRERFPIATYVVSRHTVSCAISRQVSGGSARVREAFERMGRDGGLHAAIDRWLPAH